MRHTVPIGTTRRLGLVAATLLLIAPSVHAQRARQFRVGVLFTSTREAVTAEMGAFLVRLEELGYVRGRNLEVVARFADGVPARLPELARELVEQKVDVVFAPNSQGARELQKVSDRVAIIFVSGDPVKVGLVDSMAHPGRNATGFSQGETTIAAKRVELLKEAFPSTTRLGIVADSNFPGQEELAIVADAARKLRMSTHVIDAHSREQHLEAIARLRAAGVDAFYFVFTGSSFAIRGELVAAVRDTRLPAIYGQSRFADEGGLVAYSWRTLKFSALAAEYADRILRGARPADLPVQGPTEIELVVNMATARAQGLKVPQSILISAARLIE